VNTVIRGGFVWFDDCVLNDISGGRDLFFQSCRKNFEEKVFPGKKMELLLLDHEIFHNHFDMPKGLPYCQGPMTEPGGMYDDKAG